MEEPVIKRPDAFYRDAIINRSTPYELKCPTCGKPLQKSMTSDKNFWPNDPKITGANNIYGDPVDPGDRMVTNYKIYNCVNCGRWVLEYTFNKKYH